VSEFWFLTAGSGLGTYSGGHTWAAPLSSPVVTAPPRAEQTQRGTARSQGYRQSRGRHRSRSEQGTPRSVREGARQLSSPVKRASPSTPDHRGRYRCQGGELKRKRGTRCALHCCLLLLLLSIFLNICYCCCGSRAINVSQDLPHGEIL